MVKKSISGNGLDLDRIGKFEGRALVMLMSI